MCRELGERDWADLELTYWRHRLVRLLERQATVVAFRELTAHADPAAFSFDFATRCMRRAG